MSDGHESTTSDPATDAPGRRRAHAFVAAFAGALLTALLLSPRAPSIAPVPPLATLPAGPVAGEPVAAEAPSPRRVSTSPDENSGRATATQARPQAVETENATPLTRAAARKRIEKISPGPWLARFGPVSVERRE